MTGRARANGEGSIFPYRNSYAAYTWVRTPNGQRHKKWVYGKTRDEVHDKWISLQQKARDSTVATRTPTVGEYVTYWLEEIIKPNRGPVDLPDLRDLRPRPHRSRTRVQEPRSVAGARRPAVG
jgi:hypothetical protein